MDAEIDENKAKIYLRYLADASKKKNSEVQVSPGLSEKLNRLSKRLDKLIQLEELHNKRRKFSKAELKIYLQKRFDHIKALLKQAKEEKVDNSKLLALIERAESIKKRINELD